MTSSSLVVRTRPGGAVVDGSLPERHVFHSRILEKWLDMGIASVEITLNLAEGPVTYRVVGYEAEDGVPNLRALEAVRVKGKEV